MINRAIIMLPLAEVFQAELASRLQHLLRLQTVGSLLLAWRNPYGRKEIERLFDSPQQARHALATCAAWLGVAKPPPPEAIPSWWPDRS